MTNGNTSATAGVQKDDNVFIQYLLQWHRRRGNWRSKLYPDTLRNALTDTNADSIVTRGDSDGHANSS